MTNKPFSSSFVWFDHVTHDVPRAIAFYGELFHWKTQEIPAGPGGSAYTMLFVGDQGIGGIMKPMSAHAPKAQWVPHLSTLDARASSDKVTQLGGTVVAPATKVGDFGTMAVATDPLGGPFALWQPANPGAHTGDYKGVASAPCWNELLTADVARSVAFYTALGGFTETTAPMPDGTYHLLHSGDKSRAGVMRAPMPMPQQWVPYIQVANADETVARAKSLGATIHVAGDDVPNVGRIASFSDPQGGIIGILQPAV